MTDQRSSHTLSEDRVDIWLTSLNDPTLNLEEGLTLLSNDERKRADRLKVEKKRRQFIIGRSFLRTSLAGYLNLSPQELTFTYGKDGKPVIVDEALSFNASHSGEYYLLAVTKSRTIGIDIERERDNLDYLRVAERFFSPEERAELASIPPTQQQLAFFRAWTRKEAYLKALGSGLRFPLDQFVVSLGAESKLLANHRQARELERWQMVEVDVPDGYQGAIVIEGHGIIETKLCSTVTKGQVR